MARFYNPREADFVDDFVFQPDWEIAKLAIMKKDAEEKEKADKYALLKNVIFNYDENADEKAALAVKDKWDKAAQLAALQINQNPNEYLSHIQTLNDLSNKLEKDRKFGEIAKIERNYEGLKKFKETVDASPNGATKDMYGRLLKDYYEKVNGEGAFVNPFSQTFYEDKGYTPEEFLESDQFKSLPEHIRKNLGLVQGKFVYTSGKEIKQKDKEDIQAAYKMFIENNPNLPGLFDIVDRYGNRDAKFLDEQGKVSFAKDSLLGRNTENLGIYAYKNVSDILEGVRANDYDLMQFGKDLEKYEDLAEGNIEVAKLILENDNLRAEQSADVMRTLGELKGNMSAGGYAKLFNTKDENGKTIQIRTYEDLKKVLTKNGWYGGKLKNIISTRIKRFTENYTAGWDIAIENGADEQALKKRSAFINRNLQNAIDTKGINIKMPKNRFESGKDGKYAVYTHKFNTMYGSFNIELPDGNSNDAVGKTFIDKNGRKLTITGVRYSPNSFVPILNKDKALYKGWKGNDLRENDGTFAMTYDYVIDTGREVNDGNGNLVPERIYSSAEGAQSVMPTLEVRASYDMRKTGVSAGQRLE